MQKNWESVFVAWAKGPSSTEQDRAENAEKQIRKAIGASKKLNCRDIKVFTQGSYRNRVNIRKDSDVDIGVLCYDSFFPAYPDNNVKNTKAQIAEDTVPATYIYQTFKNELEEALVAYFGKHSVKRGNKAFDIKENSYRVEADVVAFFEHRRYDNFGDYISGVEMVPDNSKTPNIRNWPEQHYENGILKNTLTNRKYKRVVRILKSLSSEMSSNGIKSAEKAPNFLVECLVWNTPIELFDYASYYDTVRSVLAYLFNNTIDDSKCNEWGEVSELKYLFKGSQPWTRQDAHNFTNDAWNYIGYE